MLFRFSEHSRLDRPYCWSAGFFGLSGFYWGLMALGRIFEISLLTTSRIFIKLDAMKMLLPFFIAHVAFAESLLPLGTYSGFSESHSTVAFELMKDGKALITTEFYDGEGDKKKVIDKKEKGSWTYKEPTLTVTFGKYKDHFKKGTNCYENRPCFKFDSSESKEKSPLDVTYEFVNWDAKPPKK